ncbi:MAG TPA: right-handed parallel beta-helix repeat-containing protein [Polyangia bacterium]
MSLARVAAAATTVAAGTYDAATWTAAGSPYLVQGDVTFTQLTIEAGATVRVSSSHPGRTNPFSIAVGDLVITGRPEALAVIEADSDLDAAWNGFSVTASAAITGAVVRGAATGIDVSSAARASIARSVIERCTIAMTGSQGPVDVDAVLFEDISRWGISAGAGALRVTNSVFRAAGQAVMVQYGGTVSVVNCTFEQSLTAVDFINQRAPASVTVKNSIISNNGVATAYNKVQGAQLTIVNTDAWQNTSSFVGDQVVGENSLSADPLYVGSGDLHLQAGSPCIDKGSADGAPDHDFDFRPRPRGAAVDLGAYEFDDGSGGSGGAGGGGASGGVGGRAGAAGGAGGAGDAAGVGGATAGTGGALSGTGGSASGGGGSGRAGTSGVSGARATGGGCGCALGRSRDGAVRGAWLLAALAWMLRGRQRRRR